MSRRVVIALLLGLIALDGAHARAQAQQVAQSSEQPRQLSLVVVGASGGFAKQQLARSLERSLGVKVTAKGESANLGVLSVMVARGRTTLLWTLPDGRSGVARLRGDLRGGGLNEQVVTAASSMYRGFAGAAGSGVVVASR